MGTELFKAAGELDRPTGMTKQIVAFSNVANASKKTGKLPQNEAVNCLVFACLDWFQIGFQIR
jgi:hypothetical protein